MYIYIYVCISGEVITIESLPVKLHVTEEEEYIADADDCAWHELSHGKYLNIIRVFYCHGPPAYQEIGNNKPIAPYN